MDRGFQFNPTSHSCQVVHILERLVGAVLERVPPERRPAVGLLLRAQLARYEAVLDGNVLILRRIAPASDPLPPLTARLGDFSPAEALAEAAEREGFGLEIVGDPDDAPAGAADLPGPGGPEVRGDPVGEAERRDPGPQEMRWDGKRVVGDPDGDDLPGPREMGWDGNEGEPEGLRRRALPPPSSERQAPRPGFVRDPGPQEMRWDGKKAPVVRREALEALRQFVNETGILPEGELEDQYRQVLPYGPKAVEKWARGLRTILRRARARAAALERRGLSSEDALARTADPTALARAYTERFLRRLSPPPEAALDVPNGVGVVWLSRVPAALHDRKRFVRVRRQLPDGTVLVFERFSRVGFGARAAALYEYLFSLIRTLPEEAFRPDPAAGVRYFDVPVRHIKELLGVKQFDTKTFRYVVELLAAQFRGWWFASPAEGARWGSIFEGAFRTKGRKAVLRVGVRERFLRGIREGEIQTRSFSPEALAALARASDPAAALARWLAVHFHGDAYANVPLRVPVAELYRYCHGEPDGDPPPGTLRRFRSEVRRAVEEINRLGLLRLLAVREPASVAVSVERDLFVFRRVAALKGPADEGSHKPSEGGDIDASVEAWLAERTEADPQAETETGVLYADYTDFCRARGLKVLGHKAWGRAMGRRFRRWQVWRGRRRVRVWRGVRLREETAG